MNARENVILAVLSDQRPVELDFVQLLFAAQVLVDSGLRRCKRFNLVRVAVQREAEIKVAVQSDRDALVFSGLICHRPPFSPCVGSSSPAVGARCAPCRGTPTPSAPALADRVPRPTETPDSPRCVVRARPNSRRRYAAATTSKQSQSGPKSSSRL